MDITWGLVVLAIIAALALAFSNSTFVVETLDEDDSWEDDETAACALCGSLDTHKHEPDWLCQRCCMYEMEETDDDKLKWHEDILQYAHDREFLLAETLAALENIDKDK